MCVRHLLWLNNESGFSSHQMPQPRRPEYPIDSTLLISCFTVEQDSACPAKMPYLNTKDVDVGNVNRRVLKRSERANDHLNEWHQALHSTVACCKFLLTSVFDHSCNM